jgi:hypothetical protein
MNVGRQGQCRLVNGTQSLKANYLGSQTDYNAGAMEFSYDHELLCSEF